MSGENKTELDNAATGPGGDGTSIVVVLNEPAGNNAGAGALSASAAATAANDNKGEIPSAADMAAAMDASTETITSTLTIIPKANAAAIEITPSGGEDDSKNATPMANISGQPLKEETKNGQAQQTTIITENVTTVTVPPMSGPASSEAPVNGKGKMDLDATLANFKVLYVVAQLCGLTLIVLVGSWIGVHMGGLGGSDNPSLEFNWHPLLMTIGLIFLYGNSILVYRGFRTVRKKTLKIAHASIHMAAFLLTVIALKAVFDSHNLAKPNPIPNMYSLHSWLGLSAVIIFCLQYVAGFTAYLAPGMRDHYKLALMPFHIYFGLFGFVLAIASALMGLTEKAIFSIASYSSLPSAGVIANIIGVLYVVFGGLVVYLTTEASYKRKPLPEDTVLLTGATE